jgi:SLOG cluster2
MPEREQTLSGRLVGLSAGDSQDVRAYGLLPRHLDIVFGAIVTALVLRGARIAYGGDLRQRGFTQQLYESVAEAYANAESGADKPPGPAPFVHYLAANIWMRFPSELETWLTASASLVEVRFMSGDGYIAVYAQGDKFIVENGSEPARGLSSAAEVLRYLQQTNKENLGPSRSLALMRKAMGRDCDVRILLGGKMFDYMGDEPGIGAEARDSLAQGAAVLPLGGFGGATRDVAIRLRLLKTEGRPRDPNPRGPGYDRVMGEIEGQGELAWKCLDGKVEEASTLARTTDTREAARLVVEILQGLPRRTPRP